jgi:hypothetical protein
LDGSGVPNAGANRSISSTVAATEDNTSDAELTGDNNGYARVDNGRFNVIHMEVYCEAVIVSSSTVYLFIIFSFQLLIFVSNAVESYSGHCIDE